MVLNGIFIKFVEFIVSGSDITNLLKLIDKPLVVYILTIDFLTLCNAVHKKVAYIMTKS